MSKIRTSSFAMGFAMFSMFFGAGNITFPIVVGQAVQGGLFKALLGLLITAVFIPFAGLMAITLFNGSYMSFFTRIGKIPGYAVILLLLALVGPFGGIPRCITLIYETMTVYFLSLHLFIFNVCICFIVFLCCWKKNRALDLIGYVLTPVLLAFLLIIIIKGVFFTPEVPLKTSAIQNSFLYGLKEGYNTMDLLASFFFSALVYQTLKSQMKDSNDTRSLILPVFKACLIGAFLLSVIYIGFSYVAARYSDSLSEVPLGQLLGSLGYIVLGSNAAGLIVSISIALACLTTMIALTVICSEFLQKHLLKERINYKICLVLVLIVSLLISSLKFESIIALLSPVLQSIYPALLALSLLNILYKLFNFKPIKTPVYTIFIIVLLTLIFKG